ncbi:MAG: YsnF/AvaK domain-containing protein [Chloroflexota bacterium]|nr:YsnF/AvaK domain-containing protein [Chloroflexota bacterium]
MLQQGATIRPGMRVQDMSGVDLGTVEQVLVSPDGQNYRLLLNNGQVRVPGDLVGSVQGDQIRLKLSAQTIESTTWGDMPADYTAAQSFQLQGPDLDVGDTLRVERFEENLRVEKTLSEVGSINVRKRVVEEPQTLTVDVNREVYDVQQVAVERAWQPGDDAPHNEGDTIVIPIISERLEVIRRKVVTGELRLTKRMETEQRQITEMVRREVVEVDGPEGVIRGQAGAGTMTTQ